MKIKILRIIPYYLLGLIGIIFISIVPKVIHEKGITDIPGYFIELTNFFQQVLHIDSWTYIYKDLPYPIFSFLWDPYIYSMEILLSAILVGFTIAFTLAILTYQLPKPIKVTIDRFLDFFESIPDLVIALFLQFFVIAFYKANGVLLFGFTTFGEEKVYLAPIITLSILPMIFMYKIMLLMLEEENLKDYVEFAKSKGFKNMYITMKHILKNIMPSFFNHSKVIIWGTLSSQFVIEHIFNVRGIFYYITLDFRPIPIAVILILIFTPFFFFYQIVEGWLYPEIKPSLHEVRKKHRVKNISFQKIIARFKDSIKDLRSFKWSVYSPWKLILSLGRTFILHMKNWKFAVGFIFIFSLIAYSYLYSIITDSRVRKQHFRYGEDGSIIGGPPHAPTEPFILGSDPAGYSLLDQLVVGAKYTLFFALLIAFLRVFIGFLFGVWYAFGLKAKTQSFFERVVESYHFLPLTVIAYLLLYPILWGPWDNTFFERVSLEVAILTILVVPLTSILIGNEIKQVLRQEFIMSTRVLGGRPLHILSKHVIPHIAPRIMILFGQQFIQTLVIFMHLGVFSLFFGGTLISDDPVFRDPPKSPTMEWAGLIGVNKEVIFGQRGWYWMAIFPLLAFVLSIFAMQMVIQGVKEIQQAKVGVLYKINRKKRKEQVVEESKVESNSESFTFVNNRDLRIYQQ